MDKLVSYFFRSTNRARGTQEDRLRLFVEPLEDRNLCSIFTNLRALQLPSSVAFGPDHNLYVASSTNHAILRFDGNNGRMLPASGQTGATFVPYVKDPVIDMAFGPDGNLYVGDFAANKVLGYDGATGAFLAAIGGAELSGPAGLAFGPDGALVVSSFKNNQVLRYDVRAKAFLGTLIASGPVAGPRDLAFAPDGALCVDSAGNNSILRYDGTTGTFIESIMSVPVPRGLAFGSDGYLYVSSYTSGTIVRYAYAAGAGILPTTYVSLSGIGGTRDFAFDADGRLYVVNSGSDRVRRIDSATGKASVFDQFVSRTNVYINSLDIHRFERNGSDYMNPAYSPLRLGKPLSQITPYDYDFHRVAQVENFLVGVDRRSVLHYIFNQVTAGATNDTERQLKVLAFLQQASNHNVIQPMYSDRTMVTDPLVLLELGEMQCGHVARLAVDLFASAGYQGRLVLLFHHEIAEIRYGGRWHYFDADVFGDGQVVRNPDGTIPSVADLSRQPYRIDALFGPYQEPDYLNRIPLDSPIYPSYYYFSVNNPKIAYLYKTASATTEGASRYYGWDHYQIVPAQDVLLNSRKPFYSPGAPVVTDASMTPTAQGKLQVSILWNASKDGDHDLRGYRIFVSRQSRDWNYKNTVLPLKSGDGNWTPDMYDARFTLPQSEVALLTVTTTSVTFVLDNPADYYVSVMPFDAHGEAAGRTQYSLSEEIRIPTWK